MNFEAFNIEDLKAKDLNPYPLEGSKIDCQRTTIDFQNLEITPTGLKSTPKAKSIARGPTPWGRFWVSWSRT